MKAKYSKALLLLASAIIISCSENKEEVAKVKGEFPLKQTSGIAIAEVTDSSAVLMFTPGDGDHRLLLVSDADSCTLPVNGRFYTAASLYSDSARIDSTHTYVVYNSAERGYPRQFIINGLKPNSKYIVRACEFHGKGNATKYLTTAAASNPRELYTKFLAPADVKTTKMTSGGFEFKWTCTPAAEYCEFDLATDSEFKNRHELYTDANIGNAGIFELADLKRGTYYYRLRYVTPKGKSPYSDAVKVNVK